MSVGLRVAFVEQVHRRWGIGTGDFVQPATTVHDEACTGYPFGERLVLLYVVRDHYEAAPILLPYDTLPL